MGVRGLWALTSPSSPDGRRSLDFAACRPALHRHRWELHGLHPIGAPAGPSGPAGRLLTFRSPTRAEARAVRTSSGPSRSVSRRSASRPPSVCAPPPTSPTPSTSPGPSLDPSEPRLPASARAPPSWFLTTSTVFSGVRFPACCSRYRTWGSSGCTRVDRRSPKQPRIASRIPSDAHTLRRLVPRRQPYRIAATAPLLPFRHRSVADSAPLAPGSSAPRPSDPIASRTLSRRPRCSEERCGPADSRVWHRRRVRGVLCRCRQWTLVPSMGFLPLRDLPHAVGVRALARIRSRVGSNGAGSEDPAPPPSASVRRSVRDLAAAGLPGVLDVKDRLDLGVGLARKRG